MSGLLLGIVLSVRTCWFHNMVTLPSYLVSTDFSTWSYQFIIIIIIISVCCCCYVQGNRGVEEAT